MENQKIKRYWGYIAVFLLAFLGMVVIPLFMIEGEAHDDVSEFVTWSNGELAQGNEGDWRYVEDVLYPEEAYQFTIDWQIMRDDVDIQVDDYFLFHFPKGFDVAGEERVVISEEGYGRFVFSESVEAGEVASGSLTFLYVHEKEEVTEAEVIEWVFAFPPDNTYAFSFTVDHEVPEEGNENEEEPQEIAYMEEGEEDVDLQLPQAQRGPGGIITQFDLDWSIHYPIAPGPNVTHIVTSDHLDITPGNNSLYSAQLWLSFTTSQVAIDVEELEIRLPLDIFFDRDGVGLSDSIIARMKQRNDFTGYTDNSVGGVVVEPTHFYLDLMTPEQIAQLQMDGWEDEDFDYPFTYRVEGDEIVIYNFLPLEAGARFTDIGVAYRFYPSMVKDQQLFGDNITINSVPLPDIEAEIIVYDSGGTVLDSEVDGPLTVKVDTDAQISTLTKQPHNNLRPSLWAWGTPTWSDPGHLDPVPSAGDGYWYLVWEVYVRGHQNNTQPYTITIDDLSSTFGSLFDQSGEILKVSTGLDFSVLDPPDTMTDIQLSPVDFPSTSGDYFRVYVLVRYDEDDLLSVMNPTTFEVPIKNEVAAELVGVDGATDNEDTVGNSLWVRPKDEDPYGDLVNVEKWFDDSLAYFNRFYGYTTFLMAGYDVIFPSFYIYGIGLGWINTWGGTEPVRFEMRDDLFHISAYSNILWNSPNMWHELGVGDYELIQFYIVDFYAWEYNDVNNDPPYNPSITSTPSNPMYVYYRTQLQDESDWSLLGTITSDGTNYYFTSDDNSVSNLIVNESNQLLLPEGTVGIMFSYTTDPDEDEAGVSILANVTPKIMATQEIQDVILVQQSLRSYLFNMVEGRLYDFQDNLIGSIEEQAVMEFLDMSPSSFATKSSGYTRRDKKNSRDIVTYHFDVTFSNSQISPGLVSQFGGIDNFINLAIDENIMWHNNAGVLYDLLPLGAMIDLDSIQIVDILTPLETTYLQVNQTHNWKNSGRTMIEITFEVEAPTSGVAGGKNFTVSKSMYGQYITLSMIRIRYDVIFPWASILDYYTGKDVVNQAAFHMPNMAIKGYTPDLFAGMVSSPPAGYELFADLNTHIDGRRDTFYSQYTHPLDVVGVIQYGLTKAVRADEDMFFKQRTAVNPDSLYHYHLRFKNDPNHTVSGLIIYDILEVYPAPDAADQWQGMLESIFIHVPEGVHYTIYYSTTVQQWELGFLGDNATPNSHADLTSSSLWSSTPPLDLSTVTAIAVDLSQNEHGQPQVIQPKQAVNIYMTMRSPEDFEAGFDSQGQVIYAWNNVYAMMDGMGKGLHFGYTGPTQVELNALDIEKNAYLHDGSRNNGREDEPTLVVNGETLTYRVKVTNTADQAIQNIDVRDVIPNRLDIQWNQGANQYETGFEITYEFNGGGTIEVQPTPSKTPATDQGMVTLWLDGQELVFNVYELLPGESVTFTIPTLINTGGQTSLFINEAVITSFADFEVDIHSNSTYHRTDGGYAQFYFHKLDNETNDPIGDVTFKLYHYEGVGTPPLNYLITSDNDVDWTLIGTESSNALGLVSFGVLSQGIYQLVEVSADGYIVPSGQWRVEIGEVANGIPKITSITGANGVVPPPVLSQYQISFQNTWANNITFELYRYIGTSTPTATTNVTGPTTSWERVYRLPGVSLGEQLQFRLLEPGYYQMRTTGHPTPANRKQYRFYIDGDGALTQTFAGSTSYQEPHTFDINFEYLGDVMGELANVYDHVLFNTPAPPFNLRKLSSSTGEPLAEVTFELHRYTGNDTPPNNVRIPAEGWEQVGGSVTSGQDGFVDFGTLEPGIYQLVETATAEGYRLPPGQWRMTVDGLGEVTVDTLGNIPPLEPVDGEDWLYELENYVRPLFDLPFVGGVGVGQFIVIGLSILAVAAALWMYLRKKRKKIETT